MSGSKLNQSRSRRSLLGAIAVTGGALLVATVPGLIRAGHQERNRFSTRRDDLKRHAKWLLVGRAVWKVTRRVRVWLPVALTVITWRSHLKHAPNLGTHAVD